MLPVFIQKVNTENSQSLILNIFMVQHGKHHCITTKKCYQSINHSMVPLCQEISVISFHILLHVATIHEVATYQIDIVCVGLCTIHIHNSYWIPYHNLKYVYKLHSIEQGYKVLTIQLKHHYQIRTCKHKKK